MMLGARGTKALVDAGGEFKESTIISRRRMKNKLIILIWEALVNNLASYDSHGNGSQTAMRPLIDEWNC